MAEELLKELKIIIMSTRAQVRFATREEGVSFNEHPDKIHAQFYVHHDGYPEGLGLEIAENIKGVKISAMYWEIEELQTMHGDLDYIYYVWQCYDKDTWISIFSVKDVDCHYCGKEVSNDDCIFVGTADSLIKKYKPNTND